MARPVVRRPGGARVRAGWLAAMALPMLMIAAPHAALAQGGTWGAVFPEASRTGPPDWVRPGTRIVFHVASASVANSRYQLVEDPTSDLCSPRTGKCYRRTDVSGEGTGSGSGDGWSVIDIVSVTPEQVVGAVSLYTMDRASGGLLYQPIGGGPEPAGAMDAVWLHPSIIEGIVAAGEGPGSTLVVGPYPLDGVVHDVAALVSASQDVSFDRGTGLVVVAVGNAGGGLANVRIEGEDPPRANSILTYQALKGVRDRAMPGIGAAAPGWLRPGLVLSYAGTYSTLGTSLPSTTRLDVTAVGPDWASFTATNEVGAQGMATNVATAVSGGSGPFWFDPAALAELQPGQVLDQDPTVGTTTRVGDVVQGLGGPAVWVVTEGPGTALWFQYDLATGVPTAYSLQQGGTDTTVWLQQMPG